MRREISFSRHHPEWMIPGAFEIPFHLMYFMRMSKGRNSLFYRKEDRGTEYQNKFW